jgi:hypothetical protein
LRFEDDDSAYLSWTPGSAGDRKTWTWSGWVKRGLQGSSQHLFDAYSDASNRTFINIDNSDTLGFKNITGGSADFHLQTTQVLRDSGAWYHILVKYDSTPGTPGSSNVALYINGEQVTALGTESYPSQNDETWVNNTVAHAIGRYGGGSAYFDGYLAEVHFIDGQALTPASFGETDAATNQWKPIDASGLTFGTNGFYQKYSSTELANSFTDSSSVDFIPSETLTCDVLIVGGGGGGGGCGAGGAGTGGGGAGGMRVFTSQAITAGTYSVVVGAGGDGGTAVSDVFTATKGGDSSFGSLAAAEGGGAAPNTSDATSTGDIHGGSGAGGTGNASSSSGYPGTGAGSLGSDGDTAGYYGGDGGTATYGSAAPAPAYAGGGGGGASADGGDPSASGAGDGGDGLTNSFRTGSAVAYSGGGGGGFWEESPRTFSYSSGGSGGGGSGGGYGDTAGGDGTANTGGGGGGVGGKGDVPYGSALLGGDGGSGIIVIRYVSASPKATGGTITSYTDGGDTYQVHSFTTVRSAHTITANGDVANTRATLYTTDTFTSTGSDTWTCPTGVTSVEYLVVAGGGGGGINRGGGGGAGGYLAGTLSVTPSTSYTVTVGDGGTGSSSDQGDAGDDSVFSSITATGGGGGGYSAATEDGRAGGSGGGGGGVSSGGAGTTGQGNDGGGGDHNESSGGGGGASAAGVAGSGSTAGDGGDGLANSITGSSVTYAGGGGGGTYQGTAGSGGAGGGGNGGGAGAGSGVGSPGTDGLGGGGGGAGYGATGGNGGNGGSGVVVIRYIQPTPGDSSIKFDGTGDYLSIPDSDDWDVTGTKATFEFWVNPIAYAGSGVAIVMGQDAGYGDWFIYYYNSGTDQGKVAVGINGVSELNSGSGRLTGVGSWDHVAVVKEATTASSLTKIYINGVEQNSGTGEYWDDSSNALTIGGPSGGLNAYLDEIRISNTDRYTSAFTPSTTAFTADANTLLLIHSDWTGGLGQDISGNKNDFTVTNLVATDQMVDSPTNNFCTMNPLAKASDSYNTLKEGNLHLEATGQGSVMSTFAMSAGKWYWECLVTIEPTWWPLIGFGKTTTPVGLGNQNYTGEQTGSWGYLTETGVWYVDGSSAATYTAVSAGDIMQVAIDIPNNKAWIGINNTWVNSGNPSAGTNAIVTSGLNGFDIVPIFSDSDGAGHDLVANFGQDSSFAGAKTAQGNQDSNSIGDFYYEPPSGYLALCSSNLSSASADTFSYVGNGSADGPFVYMGYAPSSITISAVTYNIPTNGNPSDSLDWLANGVKIRSSSVRNTSTTTYDITSAPIEQDFKYSNAR